MTQLSDLIAPQTASTIFGYMLGVYQAQGFPVQSWQVGGVERTRLMAFATAVADISGNYIPQAAAGGFLDYASTPWLRLTSAELYNLPYNAATQTQGGIAITLAAGAGPYSYTPGSLIAVFGASGNRYLNTGSGTLPAGPSVTIVPFVAEFAGAKYNDPSSSGAITLSTPLPGATLTNIAGNFSAASLVGAGTGTIYPTGTPIGPHQVTIRIDVSGQSGAALWSYSLDGSAFISVGAVPSAVIGFSGITVALANSATTPSFIYGDKYTFGSPGTWVTSQGSDDESPVALAARCRNRWPTLAVIPTLGSYQIWAASTPSAGSQVTQVITLTDTVIPSQINIIVAGPAGILPSSVIAAIQTYVNGKAPITDRPVVSSPSTLPIALGGTVTVTAAQNAAAQNAIATALVAYVNGVGINGILRISAMVEQIMLVPGVIDVSGLTINGSPSNVVLGGPNSFVLPSLTTPTYLAYVSA